MNLPGNVLVFSEKILEVKLYQWQARINRLIEKCTALTRKKVADAGPNGSGSCSTGCGSSLRAGITPEGLDPDR